MSSETHLSYPEPSSSKDILPPPPAQARPLLKDRLFVGNLHPTVDEYTLLQVFSKYGKISKLDFLFHKSGPLKGKPRGYAFVEYASDDDAARALSAANDKLLRGRKLVVTHAQQAPLDSASGSMGRHKRGAADIGKPTTLSLIKSTGSGRSDGTEDKIAKMEAKLRQMEQVSAGPTLVGHPSLPQKPIGAALAVATSSSGGNRPNPSRTVHPLPALPLAQPPAPSNQPRLPIPLPVKPVFTTPTTSVHKKTAAPLVGVKMKRHKDT